MATVVAGEPQEKALYQMQLTKGININKDKPKAIENFWLDLFTKSSAISVMDEFDP